MPVRALKGFALQRNHCTGVCAVSIRSSSNSRRSPEGHVTSRVVFPKTKIAPRKSNERESCLLRPSKPTCMNSSSIPVISPINAFGSSPLVRKVSLRTVLEFFHLHNLSRISFEEAMFLHVLYGSLATQARLLAAILPGSLQRPLQALLSKMSVSCKNYSDKNAVHKRPSGSPASLRKRS